MINLFILFIALWSCYHSLYFSSIDPHNLQEQPNRIITLLKTGVVIVPVFLLRSEVVSSEVKTLLGTLSLSLLVVPCLFSPVKFREDEIPSKARRFFEGWVKVKIGRAILLKVGSLVLAAASSFFVGKWWFIFVSVIATVLMLGKSFTANLLVQDESFNQLPEQEQMRLLNSVARLGARGCWGCLLATSLIGYLIVTELDLNPLNWYGFVGLLGGTLAGALFEAVDA